MPLSSHQNSRDQLIDYGARIKKYAQQIYAFLVVKRSKSMPIVRRYSQRTVDATVGALLVLFLTYILITGIVFITRTLWILYASAPVGADFATYFPERAAFFQFLSRVELFGFSYDVTMTAFKICLVTAMGCQVFHISRYFYFSRGWVGRLMGWGSLLAAGAAYPIWVDYAMDFFAWAWLLAAIPTLCVIATCFNWAQIVLPEIGDMVFHESVLKLVTKVKTLVRKIIEGD